MSAVHFSANTPRHHRLTPALVVAILLVVPFIQLGLSYYLSVATFAAILTAATWNIRLVPQQPLLTIALGLTVSGMFLCLIDPSSSRGGAEFLRVAREALFFVVMVAGMQNFARTPPSLNTERLSAIWVVLSIGFLVLSIIQRVQLAEGHYLGFAPALFAQTAGNLPDFLALRYTNPRPTGTFSEPSYFAFVITSLIVMISPLAKASRRANFCIVALVIAGLMTASLSFALLLPVLGYVVFWRGSTRRTRMYLVLLAAIVAFVFAISTGERISRRLNSPTTDRSTNSRIIAPATVLPAFLAEHPSGVTFATAPAVMHPYVSPMGISGTQAFDSAALDMFFFYGVFGVPILIFLFWAAGDATIRLYLAASLMFNGAFFSIDKASIILLTVALLQAGRYYVANKTQMAPLGGFARAHAPRLHNFGVAASKRIASRNPGP